MSETQAEPKQQAEETKAGEKFQKRNYEKKGGQGGDYKRKVYVEKGKEGAAEEGQEAGGEQ